MARRTPTRTRRAAGRLRSRRPSRADRAEQTAPTDVVEAPPEAPVPAEPAPIVLAEEAPPSAPPTLRIALVAAAGVLAAAIMSGGVFIGSSGRITAAVAGILGIALAVWASRSGRPALMYLSLVVGLGVITLLMVVPTGFGNVLDISDEIRKAARLGNLLRPPVDFLPGWRAVLGFLMGAIGFGAAWVGLELRRPALALAVPLPVIAISAISVPESQQLATGLVALALFAVGLGILSGTEIEGDQTTSLAYELRRAVRALPLIGVITLVMYLLAQTNFLFPDPLYDPAQEAQRPRAVPLSEVEDRVLFRVDSSITGPWRAGTLDVYDGADWRLPPFASTNFVDVSRSGVVDEDLAPGLRAEIEIAGLSGAVLPGLANLVGVVAEGPKLVYDRRTQNIRLKQGQVAEGLRYVLVASQLPSVQRLRETTQPIPEDVQKFLEIPEPPPVIQALLESAPSDNAWNRLDFVRNHLLRTVVASGSGTPVSVAPDRVEKMLTVQPESTPFEIVATEAMLARWSGVPARIGYGFDGGDEVEGLLEVRPRHGATWLEVYFPGFKWIPVIGRPLQAKTALTQTEQQQTDLEASQDIAVQVYFPTVVPPASQLLERVRSVVAIVLPIIGALVLLYYSWPAVRKTIRRNRRRTWALAHGPAARIAVAYAEWRDHATDYGYVHPSDTPLMFLNRVVPDEEHTELAWLVTRALWGDLRYDVSDRDASASEELSKSLRRRVSQTQTFVMRVIAGLSRLSIRHPYGAELGVGAPREIEVEHVA